MNQVSLRSSTSPAVDGLIQPEDGNDDPHAIAADDDEVPTKKIDERRHLSSIAALCLCMLTHSYLLISVFPYSGFMAMHLVPGLNEESAGPYAGLVASSFMFGRALGSYPWGRAADLYGRRTVLRVSLALSAGAALSFGVSRSLSAALAARFFLGLSNGMPGTAKTLASELAGGVAALETKGMGLIFSMWGVGFLFSPAVGGWLADPVAQYPTDRWVLLMKSPLVKFPFLLPNVVGVALCLVSLAGVTCSIEETLLKEDTKEFKFVCCDLGKELCKLCRRDRPPSKPELGEAMPLIVRNNDTVANDADRVEQIIKADSDNLANSGNNRSASIASLWENRRTRQHLMAYWLYSFVIICIDEAFPLFCMSKEGGLRIPELAIGKILSASGLIYAFLQYAVYAVIVQRWGIYPALKVGSLISVLLVLTVPLSVPLNDLGGSHPGETSPPAFLFLVIVMATIRIFTMIFTSCITIATNNTVPATHRATMNGLSMLGGSFAKGLGPTFAGLLTSFSLSSGFVNPMYWGSALIFGTIGGLGLAATCYMFCFLDEVDSV